VGTSVVRIKIVILFLLHALQTLFYIPFMLTAAAGLFLKLPNKLFD